MFIPVISIVMIFIFVLPVLYRIGYEKGLEVGFENGVKSEKSRLE